MLVSQGLTALDFAMQQGHVSAVAALQAQLHRQEVSSQYTLAMYGMLTGTDIQDLDAEIIYAALVVTLLVHSKIA